MEGFEIICKYNERCMQWRAECCKLISDWALTTLSDQEQKEPRFIKETSALTGFLCAKGSTTRELIEAVHAARIEHVVLALRYLRDRSSTKKPACNFCTEKGGNHVAACIGETPRCIRVYCGEGITMQCIHDNGHAGPHAWNRTKEGEERK